MHELYVVRLAIVRTHHITSLLLPIPASEVSPRIIPRALLPSATLSLRTGPRSVQFSMILQANRRQQGGTRSRQK